MLFLFKINGRFFWMVGLQAAIFCKKFAKSAPLFSPTHPPFCDLGFFALMWGDVRSGRRRIFSGKPTAYRWKYIAWKDFGFVRICRGGAWGRKVYKLHIVQLVNFSPPVYIVFGSSCSVRWGAAAVCCGSASPLAPLAGFANRPSRYAVAYSLRSLRSHSSPHRRRPPLSYFVGYSAPKKL